MALDTTEFDNQIAKLQPLIDAAQSELDKDQFQLLLVDHQAKGKAINDLQIQLNEVTMAKAKAIGLQAEAEQAQAKIDANTLAIADLKTAVTSQAEVSVQAEPLTP